jgi:PAS domain S-box-containing protein
VAGSRKASTGRNKSTQSGDIWEEVFNAIPELVSIHDQDYRIIKINKAFSDTIGLQPDQIIGKKCFEVIHGKTGPWPGCPHQRALQSKKYETEEIHEPRLGIDLQVSCTPIVNDRDEIIGSVHIARNISEQRKTELALRTAERTRTAQELEDRLNFERMITDISARFISISGDQMDTEIELAQQQVCECLDIDVSTLWQLPADQPGSLMLTHKYVPPDFPPSPEIMNAKEYVPWVLEKILQGESIILSRVTDAPAEAAQDLDVWQRYGIKSLLTLPLSTGGGTVFGALSFSVTRDEKDWPAELVNRLQLVAGIFSSALARKMTEDALRESQERLGLAADSAGAGLWSWDFKTGLIWATEKARMLYGYSPAEQVTYDDFLSKIHPDDLDRVIDVTRQAFEERTDYRVEYRIVLPDGSIRWISTRGRTSLNRSGESERMMGVFLDISQRKHGEDELAQLRLELAHLARVTIMNEISTSLAHEINQPLGAILNNASAAQLLISQIKDGSEEISEILTDIIGDARRAGDVIRKIRGLVKKGDVRFEPLPVNMLIEEVVELARNSIIMNKVSLHLDLTPDLARVSGDRVRLQQVMVNLITNALEAMKGKPSKVLIISTTMESPDLVTVSVSDSGTGIRDDHKHSLFEPFFTTKNDGLGMGLRICRSIIEEHGGRIWAENNATGGATVSFSLKALKGESA